MDQVQYSIVQVGCSTVQYKQYSTVQYSAQQREGQEIIYPPREVKHLKRWSEEEKFRFNDLLLPTTQSQVGAQYSSQEMKNIFH